MKLPKVESLQPRRGDIWSADLEPTRGSEIQSRKFGPNDTRPVLVLTRPKWGTRDVYLCVPLTEYEIARDVRLPWRVPLLDAPGSGLYKLSGADVSQTRALDISRFVRREGRAHPLETEAAASMLTKGVGADPVPTSTPKGNEVAD